MATLTSEAEPVALPVPRGPLAVACSPGGLRVSSLGALARSEGIRGATPDWLAPDVTDALAFAANEVERLAKNVGGGTCGEAPSSMVRPLPRSSRPAVRRSPAVT